MISNTVVFMQEKMWVVVLNIFQQNCIFFSWIIEVLTTHQLNTSSALKNLAQTFQNSINPG